MQETFQDKMVMMKTSERNDKLIKSKELEKPKKISTKISFKRKIYIE